MQHDLYADNLNSDEIPNQDKKHGELTTFDD